jgi:hypothetical protein
LAKSFKKLYLKLQPGSSALRTLSSLKDKVAEVDALREKVITAFGDDCISAALEKHYLLGIGVLVASRGPTAPMPPRPKLNTADLGEIF